MARHAAASLLVMLSLWPGAPARAEANEAPPEGWQGKAWGTLYYTDDVAIFSASRRLSLNADPTQPALDDRLTGQGADGVYETGLKLAKTVTSDYGTTRLEAIGDGYIFMTRTRFTHGTLRVQAKQSFTDATALNLSYYFSPDLYLGENVVRQPIPEQGNPAPDAGPIAAEVLTSQVMALRLDQRVTPDVEVQLLGRFGLRRYDPQFAERDLNFWTVGPHLDWRLTSALKWLVGYHFERGIADGRYQPQLADDVSYDNHFVSTELEYAFAERYQLTLGLHYELNDWLSRQMDDPRYGTAESVYQGELMLSHTFSPRTRLYGGVQYSNRSVNTDAPAINNVNVALGMQLMF